MTKKKVVFRSGSEERYQRKEKVILPIERIIKITNPLVVKYFKK
jgi:hypothetical protein